MVARQTSSDAAKGGLHVAVLEDAYQHVSYREHDGNLSLPLHRKTRSGWESSPFRGIRYSMCTLTVPPASALTSWKLTVCQSGATDALTTSSAARRLRAAESDGLGNIFVRNGRGLTYSSTTSAAHHSYTLRPGRMSDLSTTTTAPILVDATIRYGI